MMKINKIIDLNIIIYTIIYINIYTYIHTYIYIYIYISLKKLNKNFNIKNMTIKNDLNKYIKIL